MASKALMRVMWTLLVVGVFVGYASALLQIGA